MSAFDRRLFLQVSAAAGALTVVSANGRDAHAGAPSVNRLTGRNMRVEVKGMYSAVADVVSIDPGSVFVAIEQGTSADKPGSKTFTYGAVTRSPLELCFVLGAATLKLKAWADKAFKAGGSGDALRRDLSVYYLARNNVTVLRTINVFGCFPKQMSVDAAQSHGQKKVLKLVCQFDRVEVA